MTEDESGNPNKETKYTSLRNQIGHTQLNTDIMGVENDIQNSYPALVKLVQNAIRTYLS